MASQSFVQKEATTFSVTPTAGAPWFLSTAVKPLAVDLLPRFSGTANYVAKTYGSRFDPTIRERNFLISYQWYPPPLRPPQGTLTHPGNLPQPNACCSSETPAIWNRVFTLASEIGLLIEFAPY